METEVGTAQTQAKEHQGLLVTSVPGRMEPIHLQILWKGINAADIQFLTTLP